MEAFLSGLSNGVLCVAYCAPVLVPYLIGQGRGSCIMPGAGIEETYRLDDGFAVRCALKKMRGKDIPDARP